MKTKREVIDRSLFLYGGLVTFALTVIAFFNLNNQNSLITLLLFLPVTIYFLIRFILSLNQQLHHFLNSGQQLRHYFGGFSMATFFNQTETSFLINFILLAIAISLIFFRISLQILQ